MKLTIEQIAKICHQANKAYCEILDDNSQVSWEESPDWLKESVINEVKYVLNHTHIDDTVTVSKLHENWLKDKLKAGWKYGLTKDIEKKEHPCLLPYDSLSEDHKLKDILF